MRKRLLKKYLKAFDFTLQNGEVRRRLCRRQPAEFHLKQSHPLVCRRRARSEQERARVLPALLKARIDDYVKFKLRRDMKTYRPVPAMPWAERGGRPRGRLFSAVLGKLDMPVYDGDLRAFQAKLDRACSAFLRAHPRALGKRIQSGNRVKPSSTHETSDGGHA